MIDPIRIHHADTADEIRDRHAQIEKRLDELGPDSVKTLVSVGGLPPQWQPIITTWLKGDRVKPKENV
jgi:hypothetical protein